MPIRRTWDVTSKGQSKIMSEPETNRTHYPTEHASAVKTVSSEFGLSFSGYHSPLPPPNVLEEYKAIDPAILTLILDMSVKEQEHRHRAEIREIEIVAYSRQMEDRAIDLFSNSLRGLFRSF